MSAGPQRRLILWSAGLALAVRLVAFAQEAAAPYLGAPLLDERWYDGAARTLLGWPGGIALDGFRPLLYPGFLAGVYAVLGPAWGPVLAVGVQHLVGVATGVLVAMLAWRLSGSARASLAAGALWALAAPPIFTEGQLLSETLFVALTTAALVVLCGERSVGRHAAAGALIGLAGQVRANALILVGVLLWLSLRGGATSPERADRWLRSWRAPLAALGSLAAVYLVGALLQTPVNSGFRILPSSGAVNLYLGNERGADGMLPRQDAPVPAGPVYRDSVEAWASREYLGAHPDAERAEPAAVSRYWLSRTAAEIRSCPSCWARLLGRKAALLLWNEEVPNHLSFDFATREDLPFLGWLPVRWWLLLALAPIGGAWLRSRGSPGFLPTCAVFLLLLALGIVAFFVNGRYRLPLWPPLVALAGCGVAASVAWARAAQWRRLAAGAGTALIGALLALVNWTDAELPSAARDLFFRSLARLERGDVEAALADARASVALEPGDAAAQVQLGNTELAAGGVAAAAAAYRRAAALDPGQPIAWNNLGVALERSGDPGGALGAYLRAAALDAAYPLDRGAIERLRAPASPPGSRGAP
jgi:hypothetical protein